MINKSLNATYSSQTNDRVTIELEFPKGFKEKDWPRKFTSCKAIFQPEMNKLVINCQTETLTPRKSWLQILVETGGYFW